MAEFAWEADIAIRTLAISAATTLVITLTP